MKDRRLLLGGAFLLGWTLLAAAVPWLPLRDPNAQPDGLVLRERPPLSGAITVDLADGSRRYAHEVRELPEGGLEYRRGRVWKAVAAADLSQDPLGRDRFWLGTDGHGRDLLSRLLHGARVSLLVGFVAALMALGVGTLVGATAALSGGWIDAALMRATDLVLAVPRLFLALLLVALYGASLTTTILVVGATTWMAAARLVRGELLSLRERDWVAAARASGAGPWRTGWRHMVPGAMGAIVVEGTLRVGDSILLEAALSFLGLGVLPPTPSWGNLIADGRSGLLDAWWISTLPGLAVAGTVIALHLCGDALDGHAPRGREAGAAGGGSTGRFRGRWLRRREADRSAAA